MPSLLIRPNLDGQEHAADLFNPTVHDKRWTWVTDRFMDGDFFSPPTSPWVALWSQKGDVVERNGRPACDGDEDCPGCNDDGSEHPCTHPLHDLEPGSWVVVWGELTELDAPVEVEAVES
jgi:hypothetical protein